MLTSYGKHTYLTQTDAALLHGIATTRKFRGISTIHKGEDEMQNYVSLNEFEQRGLGNSGRGLIMPDLDDMRTVDHSQLHYRDDPALRDKLIDFNDDEDFRGLPQTNQPVYRKISTVKSQKQQQNQNLTRILNEMDKEEKYKQADLEKSYGKSTQRNRRADQLETSHERQRRTGRGLASQLDQDGLLTPGGHKNRRVRPIEDDNLSDLERKVYGIKDIRDREQKVDTIVDVLHKMRRENHTDLDALSEDFN